MIYRFETAAQWAAGARRNLQPDGDRLAVPGQPAIELVSGTGGLRPAFDGFGRLLVLARHSRELTRGTIEFGRLAGDGPARRMVAGRTILWVLGEGGALDRYEARTGQRLTPAEPAEGWRIDDIAGDGGDGVWLAESGPGHRRRLRRLDCWGRPHRTPIELAGLPGDTVAIASTTDGTRLVAIDPVGSSVAVVVEAATGDVRSLGLDPAHHGRTTLLAAAPDDRIHLLTLTDPVLYQAVDLTRGDVEDQQSLAVPRGLGEPTQAAGGPAELIVAGTRGLARIAPRSGLADERVSTFITPALVSPLGPRPPWNRAEIDVRLPAGTAMEVSWAATDDAALISRVTALMDAPATAGLIDDIDGALPWDGATVVYRGAGDDVEHLAALLDDAAAGTLWLRVRLRTPPGRTPPELSGLRIRYPAASYLDHLPSIYQTQSELRRLLAPYELLFDELDRELDALPGRLDPATAGDDWTDYLLSWLGFPELGDLPAATRSQLLRHGAELLDQRGTRAGLERLLDLVTDGRAEVADTADEPACWILGAESFALAGAGPARLGRDTVALAQHPQPSRAGTMVLGATPLGTGCPDPELMLAQRAAVVTITLGLGADQVVLGPVIDRLLPVFVPAHCRVRVRSTGADDRDRSRRLDLDFRLGPPTSYDGRLLDDTHWRLAATTRLGRWPLAARPARPAVLDHRPDLRAGPRLH